MQFSNKKFNKSRIKKRRKEVDIEGNKSNSYLRNYVIKQNEFKNTRMIQKEE